MIKQLIFVFCLFVQPYLGILVIFSSKKHKQGHKPGHKPDLAHLYAC